MADNLRKVRIKNNGQVSDLEVYPDVKREVIALAAGGPTPINTGFDFFNNDPRSVKNYTSSGTNPFRSNQGFVTRLQFRIYAPAYAQFPSGQPAQDALTAFVANTDIKIFKNNQQIHGDNLANYIRLPQLEKNGAPIELFKDKSILMKNGQMDFDWSPPLMIQLQSTFVVQVVFNFSPVSTPLVNCLLEARLGVLEAPQSTNSGVISKMN